MEPRFQKWLRKLPRRYKKYHQPQGLWSMTIPRELAFCESYARECFSGKGRMVDLGCWYGATTFSLARGLRRNWRARSNRIIEAFDLFLWNSWMDSVADHIKMPRMYEDGESFFHDVEKLLAPYRNVVRLYQQDLLEHEPEAKPVELLFVDAMKSWPLAKKIVTGFFPLLIPGVSVVVQQDFVFHNPIAATSHLLMWRMRDHFEWLHQIPGSGSVVFLVQKKNRSCHFAIAGTGIVFARRNRSGLRIQSGLRRRGRPTTARRGHKVIVPDRARQLRRRA